MYLRRKLLIQMSGAPGSGKSTVANLLAQSIDGVVVNHDLIKSFFLENDIFFDQSAKLTYRFDWILAEDIVKQGRNVIIDSTCNYNEVLDQGTALARQYGYDYRYIECRVDDIDLLNRRLRNRVPLRSQRTGVDRAPPDATGGRHNEDYHALFKRWIENPCRPAGVAIVVDSTGSPEECRDYILKQIAPPTGVQTSNRAIPESLPRDEGFAGYLEPSIAMYPYAGPHRPAALGGAPTFPPSNPVPQINPSGYGYVGEHSAVDSILRNEPNLEPTRLTSKQRYVSRGVAKVRTSYRSDLQRRVTEFLDLDAGTTSVVCVTSGTNALRAALKAVIADDRPGSRNEIIVPAITAVSTAEAVMMEGFVPVLVDVDPNSWMLSLEATARSISERTAAIVTVDWLGTLCDLHPFRKLADEHGAKLVSDSAQSFGAIRGKPPAVDLADATIYSTGYPKVFHTGGSGGIVVCSTSQADWLEQEPSGILRHEAMPETNAYLGLRALDRLPLDLEARAGAAETYRSLLRDMPGLAFQHVAPSSGMTHYQLSVTVDASSFGLDAKSLCRALQAENILGSTERMRCLGIMPRLLRRCKVAGKLSVSRALGENSITLPIFDQLTPALCQRICSCVKAIHEQSDSIASIKSPVAAPLSRRGQAKAIDIAEKFRDYWVVPVVEEGGFANGIDGSAPCTVLVKWNHLAERKISIDEVHRRVSSRRKWNQGDMVIDELVVHTKLGATGLVLSPHGEGYSQASNASVNLDESGSSASVTLVLGRDGEAEVHKTCSHDGIDGNGRPWLERQLRFLESSVAVKETGIFVKLLSHEVAEGTVSIAFPYVPSHSLAEIALAGMDADSLLAILDDLLGEMAACVWPKSVVPGPNGYIEQAHFSRIRRRVAIARSAVPELDDVAGYEWITLNGRRLLGFDGVLEALSRHPTIKVIAPRALGEIHGDLNLHNVLCQLKSDADRPIVLIDPRGVPLLHEFAGAAAFEPGDYSYDISKLKFSLSGFSEIRKGLYTLQAEGKSFELLIKDHPGSDTMRGADRGLFVTLSSNERLLKWIYAVEPSGLRSLELRVLLGEAAHFVADSACALGRGKGEEVLPLFLIGLAKLNDVLEQIEGKCDPSIDRPKQSINIEGTAESPNYGAATIQSALLGSLHAGWTWDMLEVLVKSESTHTAHQLLSELVGECLPEGMDVHVSTHAVDHIRFPCVLVHPFVGVRGQTDAVLSGIRRTHAFLRDGGLPQGTIDGLRIVTVTSTGASTRSQYVSRQNDKLLSPGPWGISPLRLIALEANQLIFPRAGRWIVENDSFFVLSRALRAGGDSLCLLTSKRRTTGSNSPWRVCIDSTHESSGRTFATGFREIGPHETETTLLRPTSAIFMPNNLGKSLAEIGEDYAARSSPLLIDFVLPRFMRRECWIELCHSRGFGVNSDLAWSNAERIASLFPQVELAYGGDEMVFHHFGSDSEYTRLVDGVGDDPLLTRLAHLPSMARWLRYYPRWRASPTD